MSSNEKKTVREVFFYFRVIPIPVENLPSTQLDKRKDHIEASLKIYIYIYISELIFQKVATEIEHILRLSKLKEYASH